MAMAVKSARKPACEQEFEYREEWSIIHGLKDQFELSNDEYHILYSFYVEHSMYDDQSCRKRTWIDYGWSSNKTIANGAKDELCKVLQLYSNEDFIFTKEDDLDTQFVMCELENGTIHNIDKERGVFAIASESILESYFIILFSRVRNCLAHGEFVLQINTQNEKMVVMQNHYNGNVKSRCVLKLNTLLTLARTVDKSGLLS